MFGSRARGDARPDSDLDLLIIKDSDEPRHRRAIPAYGALAGLAIPTDIIWRTSAEIAEWSQVPNHVTTRAIREGKVLYERAACSQLRLDDQGGSRSPRNGNRP